MMGDDRLPFLRCHLSPDAGYDIRAARLAAGWSRRNVAAAAGVSAKTLARIERVAQKPVRETLHAICDVLGLSFDTVAGDRWGKDAFDVPENPVAAPGIVIRAMRRLRGTTLRELADVAGVSVSTLSRFERGLTASRLLASRDGGPSVSFLDRDVMLSSVPFATALGFADLNHFGASCLIARRMLLEDDPRPDVVSDPPGRISQDV